MDGDLVNFTPAKVRALRKAYEQAKKAGKDTFLFETRTLLTRYAHYLLEYLESRL
jgi:hypothetical protein